MEEGKLSKIEDYISKAERADKIAKISLWLIILGISSLVGLFGLAGVQMYAPAAAFRPTTPAHLIPMNSAERHCVVAAIAVLCVGLVGQVIAAIIRPTAV